MTLHAPASTKPSQSSAQWLSLLILAAIAGAGWVQSWKWQKLTQEANERAAVKPEPSAMASNPTLSLMQDVDLIRQNELLSEENQRLSKELKQLEEKVDQDRARAALDGRGGILR